MGNTVRVRHIHLRLGPILLAVLVIGAAAWFTADRQAKQERDPAEIITESTLKQIINVSELSTFTAVYNGIAEVASEEDPGQVDYYVSYEARVDAGVDFEGVDIAVDHEAKEVTITLPEVTITQANVDIASLDFIFYNPRRQHRHHHPGGLPGLRGRRGGGVQAAEGHLRAGGAERGKRAPGAGEPHPGTAGRGLCTDCGIGAG